MKQLWYIFLLFCNFIGYSQNYPTELVPILNTPYSNKISDYSNPMASKIQLQIITTDLSIQNRQVELFLEMKGNGISAISSLMRTGVSPLRISGGEILTLTNSELASYFKLSNLQNITTEQYSQVLPDGLYYFCFRLKDVLSGQWLSRQSCAMAYLMSNEPPFLNIPSDNEQVQVSDFQNILFSWTPRQINATNVSYTFEIREVLDPSLDPKFAFEVSRRVYKEENLRTTAFVYDVGKPSLIPGRRYAWRVRAISTSGLSENSVFKNDGYSQINSFIYLVNCSKPMFLLSERQGKASVKLMWQGHASHQKYHIQYRKKGVENAQWFETFTRNTQTIIANLQSGFEYEFRIGASCEAERYGIAQSYAYSDIQTFKIEKTSESEVAYNCGIVPKIDITNQKPLGSLVINEVFMAGDFPVQVLEIQGGNGIFSGKGFIKVPYLNDTKLAVAFENVKINTDNQLVEGGVKTEYDANGESVVEVDLIKNITDAIKSLKNVLEKQEEIQQKQEKLDQKYAKKEISEKNYDKETKKNNIIWKQLVEVQTDTEKFIEQNPLLTSEESKELKDLQQKSLLVSSKISSQDLKNASYRGKITEKILENLKSREEKFVSDFEKVIADFEKQKDEKINLIEVQVDTISKKILDYKIYEKITPEEKGEFVGIIKLGKDEKTFFIWTGQLWSKIIEHKNGEYSAIAYSKINKNIISKVYWNKNNTLAEIERKFIGGQNAANFIEGFKELWPSFEFVLGMGAVAPNTFFRMNRLPKPNKIPQIIKRLSWNGAKNIFKATDEEIAEATKRIKDYRAKNNLKGKNIGYLEGTINGKKVDDKIWLSGKVEKKEPQIFKAIKVEGSGGRSWLRNTDSEYKMLNQLAKDLGGKVGNTYPNIKGEIKIISELPYCDSCTGVIQQFNEIFPNIKLILIDGVK